MEYAVAFITTGTSKYIITRANTKLSAGQRDSDFEVATPTSKPITARPAPAKPATAKNPPAKWNTRSAKMDTKLTANKKLKIFISLLPSN